MDDKLISFDGSDTTEAIERFCLEILKKIDEQIAAKNLLSMRAPVRPCPFCGTSGQLRIERSINLGKPNKNLFWVACKNCHATGPTARTQEKAEQRWGLIQR
jgi:hypothetical protein